MKLGEFYQPNMKFVSFSHGDKSITLTPRLKFMFSLIAYSYNSSVFQIGLFSIDIQFSGLIPYLIDDLKNNIAIKYAIT